MLDRADWGLASRMTEEMPFCDGSGRVDDRMGFRVVGETLGSFLRGGMEGGVVWRGWVGSRTGGVS